MRLMLCLCLVLLRQQRFCEGGFFGLLCGTTFGVTSVLVGHPFDTVKTRMQVLNYNSMGKTIKHIMKDSGVRGLYSGMLPMLLGSAVFVPRNLARTALACKITRIKSNVWRSYTKYWWI